MRASESDPGVKTSSLGRAWRRFLRSGRPDYKWAVIVALWFVAFAVGCVGFSKRADLLGEQLSRLDVAYLSLQLFTLESGSVPPPVPAELEVARFLAPVVAAVTALKALLLILHRQIERWRARRWRGHVIVCGVGRKGALLSKRLLEQGRRVVAIEKDPANEQLASLPGRGIVTLTGDATDPSLLRNAGIAGAQYLLAVTGSDSTNAEIAVRAETLASSRRASVLTCLVHIIDAEHCELLRRREVSSGASGRVRLQFFDVYHSAARLLLSEYPVFGASEDTGRARAAVLVLGLGELGQALLAEAARQWAPRHGSTGEMLKVCLADDEAQRKAEYLTLRHPNVADVCKVTPFDLDTRHGEFQRLDALFAEGRAFSAVYVCLEDDSRAFHAALALGRMMRERDCEAATTVALTGEDGLASLLRAEDRLYASIRPFALLERTCTPGILLTGTNEILATAVHEGYVRQQEEEGQTPATNPHMVPWEELPEWLKESNRRQADHIGIKLRRVGCDVILSGGEGPQQVKFTPEEVEILAQMEHKRWVTERLLQGWQYGKGKDDNAKISPHLVPWEALPEDARERDRHFARNLPAMLARVGLRIGRMRAAR